MNKKGISLVVLVITIIVALILVSVSVITTTNAIANTTLTNFANTLTQLEDSAESYYITNNAFPTPDSNNTAKSKQDILNISGSITSAELDQEITLNGDEATEAFYEVDLSKINVTNIAYGAKNDGDSDVFYIAYPSLNVYYLKGLLVKNDYYFSLSSKLTSLVKLNDNNKLDTSTTEVITASGISVTKSKTWTNTMPLTIKTNLDADESIYISISGGTKKKLSANAGLYQKSFNLTDLFAANDVLDSGATFSVGDIDTNKNYLEVIKNKGANEIGRVRIDLSKFEVSIPTIDGITTSSYANMNTITFNTNDSISDIGQIKYDYLTLIDKDGQEKNYYNNVSSFDINYMKSKAKKVKDAKSGVITINVPKNVNQVSIAIFDKAGNYILQGVRVTPIIYTNNIIDYASSQRFTVTSNIYSTNGVSNIKYEYSTDGVTYINPQTIAKNTNDLVISNTVDYTNVNADKVYLRTEVTDNNANVSLRKTDIKIMLIDSKKYAGSGTNADYIAAKGVNKPKLATGMVAIKYNDQTGVWDDVSDPNTDTSWYDYSNKIWANARTADGSMWVWIPRYEYKIPTPHISTAQVIDINFLPETQTTASNGYIVHPAFTFGSTELTGIWVAKFEASGSASAVDLKPNVASIKNITINDVFNSCRNMETESTNRYGWGTTGTGIDTHLMKNVEWGAVAYLSSSIYGKTAEIWINPNSNYMTGQAGTGISVGSTTTTYAYNNAQYGVNASTSGTVYGVYDMSGGVWEYTAAYISNGSSNLTTYGASLLNADLKYKDVYTVTNDSREQNYDNASLKRGDAVWETSLSGNNLDNSWYGDMSYMPFTNDAFFMRGCYYGHTTYAGVFAFNSLGGITSPIVGFRPVLAVDDGL